MSSDLFFKFLLLFLPLQLLALDTPEPDVARSYGVEYISAKDAKALHDAKSATFCDARITREFITETIPDALSCMYEEKGGRENKRADFDPSIEEWHSQNIVDKNRTLVIFCNAKNCWRSYKAAFVAKEMGFRDVRWLRDGVPAWRSAGYELENNCPL
ncbi:MAG: rhodanese-like domain-containing protein [Sulfuricurvum sp.]